MTSITLVPTTIDGEARIRDVDLGRRLGFQRPSKIRELIDRHKETLSKISVLPTAGETPEGGGRPSISFYLNRKQAIFITAKSETDQATDITIEIIERFDAYERGSVPAVDPMAMLNDPAAMPGLLLTYTEKVLLLQTQNAELTPKAEFYDRFADADGLYGLQNAARVLGQGPNKFIGMLKQTYLFYQGGSLVPRVAYTSRGLFEVKSEMVEEKARYRTYMTPKGLQSFAKKLGATLPYGIISGEIPMPAVGAEVALQGGTH